MGEPRGRPRLAAEALELIGLLGDLPMEQLDCDGPVEDLVERQVDGGHAARAQLRLEPVPAREYGGAQAFQLIDLCIAIYFRPSVRPPLRACARTNDDCPSPLLQRPRLSVVVGCRTRAAEADVGVRRRARVR